MLQTLNRWPLLKPRNTGSSVRRFGLSFVVWTLVGLFFFSQDAAQSFYSCESKHWLPIFECWMLRAYIWGLLAPVVVGLARRLRMPDGYSGKWFAIHIATGLVLTTAAAFLTAFAGNALALPWYGPDLGTAVLVALLYGFQASLFTYWVIVGACEIFDHDRSSRLAEVESAQLKARLVQSQLQVLKHQLQPHFLFNALNAIIALVRRKRNAQAEELIGRLGDLLRTAMDEAEGQEVPLSRELEFLESYLQIERIRFQDRLKVELRFSPDVMNALVPYMCLQPLAENAIRHGIASRSTPGTLTIAAEARGAFVEITIADNGPGFGSSQAQPGKGIGLFNTRARLSHLYGEAAQLLITSSHEQGTLITLSVPYHLAEAAA